MSILPSVAITMGDPTGIGPEIIVKSIASGQFNQHCRPIVIGRSSILHRVSLASGLDLSIVPIASLDQWRPSDDEDRIGRLKLWCLETGESAADLAIEPVVDVRGGQAAYDCLLCAAKLALDGCVDAIVTAPLHKVSLQHAGHDWPGHTELLAHLCGVQEYAMMLYLPPGRPRHGGPAGFGVVHVTLHMALREIFKHLSIEAIDEKIRLANDVFTRIRNSLGIDPKPRIAVAALNPHGGESGRFGVEEQTIIGPAVAIAQRMGIHVVGPLPVDTLMPKAVDGGFDAVIAMYHDQGHIALKLLDMFDAVNVTLGLPIIRTSVAHGTAHDIAWQNKAEASGMVQAVLTAARMAGKKQAS
jgi:4-phospho-D-threonate 3-dehydrogenase / 4-phospho-D-erythronate 3-dehydrogenase